MSFRMCVFIEAISDRAKSGEKSGVAKQGAAKRALKIGNPAPRPASPGKPVVTRAEKGAPITLPRLDVSKD